MVTNGWHRTGVYKNSAQDLASRMKSLRQGIKKWSRNLSKLNKVINSCYYVLALLDGLENQRMLSLQKKNFRKILRDHIAKLLEAKRIFWKNRAKIKWARLGGENTKLFHAAATRISDAIILPILKLMMTGYYWIMNARLHISDRKSVV